MLAEGHFSREIFCQHHDKRKTCLAGIPTLITVEEISSIDVVRFEVCSRSMNSYKRDKCSVPSTFNFYQFYITTATPFKGLLLIQWSLSSRRGAYATTTRYAMRQPASRGHLIGGSTFSARPKKLQFRRIVGINFVVSQAGSARGRYATAKPAAMLHPSWKFKRLISLRLTRLLASSRQQQSRRVEFLRWHICPKQNPSH